MTERRRSIALAALATAIATGLLASRRRREAEPDPAAALIELWAAVADLLAAYQEAVAEEGYLGGRRRWRRCRG